MGPRGLRAVIFDFDGTLVCQTIDFALMRREVTRVVTGYGVADPGVLSLHLLELIDMAEVIAGNGSIGRRLRGEAYAAIEAIECEAASRAQVLPGVEDLLRALRQRGVRTAVVTRNAERAVRIAYPPIADAVDVFLPREAVRRAKPHPLHLQTCVASLGVPAGNTLMVGDHPMDIEAGRSAGMSTAAVLTGTGSEDDLRAASPDYVFADIRGILSLINEPA